VTGAGKGLFLWSIIAALAPGILSGPVQLWGLAPRAQARAAGDTHEAALRRLGSKLVGQLHHCLEHREQYREDIAWPTAPPSQPSGPGQPTAA
jgi:hypothetical protein